MEQNQPNILIIKKQHNNKVPIIYALINPSDSLNKLNPSALITSSKIILDLVINLMLYLANKQIENQSGDPSQYLHKIDKKSFDIL